MTLSVTMFLGLMLALMVSGKPKTYLIETVDNADILVTYINNQRKIHAFNTFSQAFGLGVSLFTFWPSLWMCVCACICSCLFWFRIKFPYNTITVCMSLHLSVLSTVVA